MAEHVIRLPDVGEGVAEAELVEWHVKVGDLVREDALLAAVMTDKATVEIPSPVDGEVLWLGARIGDVVPVGSDLVRLKVSGEEPAGATKQARASAPAPAQSVTDPAVTDPDRSVDGPATAHAPAPRPSVTDTDHSVGGPSVAGAPADARTPSDTVADRSADGQAVEVPTTAANRPTSPAFARHAPRPSGLALPPPGLALRPAHHALRPEGEKPLASPAVRQRARDGGVDLRQVPGTGPAGRVTHDDLDTWFARDASAARGTGNRPLTGVRDIKVVGLRRRIAEKMSIAHTRIPHITYVEEVDVTGLEELRQSLNGEKRDNQPRLTVLPFLMLAMVRAVAEQPNLNALFDDEAGIVHQHDGVHVGIAVQTEAGLMVPVVRHAEAHDLWSGAAEINRLAEATKNGTATRDQLNGSTITITSLGALGGVMSTPIINYPEVAIVGVNKIMIRPVWDGSAFVPRKMMNLSSSFDHRIVDGFDAARFAQRIKALLESPALIFISG
jgi:2-oxoisovalerate dehydrogenase E2 component (dihydrolipoyl transacylase)